MELLVVNGKGKLWNLSKWKIINLKFVVLIVMEMQTQWESGVVSSRKTNAVTKYSFLNNEQNDKISVLCAYSMV